MYSGNYIKEYIKDKRISTSDLAEKMNVSQSFVYQLLSNYDLSAKQVNRVCKALDVSPADIFGEKVEEPQSDYLTIDKMRRENNELTKKIIVLQDDLLSVKDELLKCKDMYYNELVKNQKEK